MRAIQHRQTVVAGTGETADSNQDDAVSIVQPAQLMGGTGEAGVEIRAGAGRALEGQPPPGRAVEAPIARPVREVERCSYKLPVIVGIREAATDAPVIRISGDTVPLIKSVFVGDSDSGKRELIQGVANDDFASDPATTIGSDFRFCEIKINDAITVKYQLFDTTGKERFRTIMSYHYQSDDCVFIMRGEEINNVPLWKADSETQAPGLHYYTIHRTEDVRVPIRLEPFTEESLSRALAQSVSEHPDTLAYPGRSLLAAVATKLMAPRTLAVRNNTAIDRSAIPGHSWVRQLVDRLTIFSHSTARSEAVEASSAGARHNRARSR